MRSSKWSTLYQSVSGDGFLAMLEKMQVCIRDSNRAISMWYLGMGIGGRETGWKKREKRRSRGVRV